MEFCATQQIVWEERKAETAPTNLRKRQVGTLKVLSIEEFPEKLYPVYEGVNVIGRTPSCPIQIIFPSISKEHASIEVIDETHLLCDLSSANKTKRGNLILRPNVQYELQDHDTISFGNVTCEYLKSCELVEDNDNIYKNIDTNVIGLASELIVHSDSESNDSECIAETPEHRISCLPGDIDKDNTRSSLLFDSDSDTDIEGYSTTNTTTKNNLSGDTTVADVTNRTIENDESECFAAETLLLPWAVNKTTEEVIESDDEVYNMETQMLPTTKKSIREATEKASENEIYNMETQPLFLLEKSCVKDINEEADESSQQTDDSVSTNCEEAGNTSVVLSSSPTAEASNQEGQNASKEDELGGNLHNSTLHPNNDTIAVVEEKAKIDCIDEKTAQNSREIKLDTLITGQKVETDEEIISSDSDALILKDSVGKSDKRGENNNTITENNNKAQVSKSPKMLTPSKTPPKVVSKKSTSKLSKSTSKRNKRKSTPHKLIVKDEDPALNRSSRARRKMDFSIQFSDDEIFDTTPTTKRTPITRGSLKSKTPDSPITIRKSARDIKKPVKYAEEESDSSQAQKPKRAGRSSSVKKTVRDGDSVISSSNESTETIPKRVGIKVGVSPTSMSLRMTSSSQSSSSTTNENPRTATKRKQNKARSTPADVMKTPPPSSSKAKKRAHSQDSSSTTPSRSRSPVKQSPSSTKKLCKKVTAFEGNPKVTFTGMPNIKTLEKIVESLGGDVTDSVTECTHLVTDKIRRTHKLLCVISRGCPILLPQWLKDSKAAKMFVGEVDYLVKDEDAENKFDFQMEYSLSRAAAKIQFLADFSIHVTDSVQPPPSEMKSIIECAGGKYCKRIPAKKARIGTTLIISCPADLKSCANARKAGIPIVSSEFILTGVLRQKAQVNMHLI